MTFLREAEKRAAQEFIISEMIDLRTKMCADSTVDTDGLEVSSELSCDSADEMLRELQGFSQGNPNDDICVYEAEQETSLKLQCLSEFKTYLEVARSYVGEKSMKQCPLEWWKYNQNALKLLAPVARKWLGCLASSVPSERAFSSAGNIVLAKRASLGDDMVRDLVFLHDNQL